MAQIIEPPEWLSTFYSNREITLQETNQATEKGALMFGFINFIIYLVIFVLFAAIIGILTPLSLKYWLGFAVLVAVIAGFYDYNDKRKGKPFTIERYHNGIVTVGGQRVNLHFTNEMSATMPKLKLAFGILGSTFDLDVVSYPIKKRTYDTWVRGWSSNHIEIQFQLSMEAITIAPFRSGYTNEEEQQILADQCGSAMADTAALMEYQYLAGPAGEGNDPNRLLDKATRKLREVLISTDVADVVTYGYARNNVPGFQHQSRRDNEDKIMVHTELGIILVVYIKDRNVADSDIANSMAEPGKAQSQRKAVETKMEAMNEIVARYKELYDTSQMSEYELRQQVLILLDEYSNEQFANFTGFADLGNIVDDVAKKLQDRFGSGGQ